ncbi:MAG: putative quinol monooxygenase [Dinoroseobacter sp.]|nr:putative quinol monooxygenase [Dinoroseobacter sp.]
MYAVTVTFGLRPGGAEEFMPKVLQNARTSLLEEPGCMRFDVCTDTARPDSVFLYELYYNREMFDRHLASKHYEAFSKDVEDLVIEKDVQTFAQVQI